MHAVETGFYAAAVGPMLIAAVPFAVSTLGWKVVPPRLAACVVFMLFAYTTSEIESWRLCEPGRMLVFLGMLLCAFARLRQTRLQQLPQTSLLFEDRLIDSFETLRLSSGQ